MQAFGSEKDRALALKTLEELPNDPRVDLARANVYEVLGRSEDQLKAANQVIRRVDDSEYLHMLKANALLSACWAYRELKNLQEAHNACDEASTIFQSSDPVAAAVVLNGVATIEADQGHCQNAKETYDYVIQITGENHANEDHAGALLNAAKMLICLGHTGDARTYLTRSLDASGKADTYDHARALILLADVLRADRLLQDAKDQVKEAIQLSENDTPTRAYALENLGVYQLELGELGDALQSFHQALAIRETLVRRTKQRRFKSTLEKYCFAVATCKDRLTAIRRP